MRLSILSVCLAFAALAAVQAKDDEALQGSWIVIGAKRDGKAVEDVNGHVVQFTGRKFEITLKDKLLYKGTCTFDAAAKPPTIDFQHTKGKLDGKTWKGIYEIQKGQMIICDNSGDLEKPRPTKFEAAAGSGYLVVILKRTEK